MATKANSRMTPLKLFSYTMVALWLIIAAFPFLWTFWGSFKVQADFLSKADWMNAISGTNTIAQTGSALPARAITALGSMKNSGSTSRTQALWCSSRWSFL